MNVQANQTMLASPFHHALRDGLDALLLVLDQQCRITACNLACEMTTGYREADLIGRPFRHLIPDNQWENVRHYINAQICGKNTSKYIGEWLTRGGEKRHIQWSCTLLHCKPGQVDHLILTGVDVTRYRETLRTQLESDSRYRALVETSADIIWEIDTRWRYRYVSPRVHDMLGYTPQEVVGRSVFDFVDTDEAHRIRPQLEAFGHRKESFQHFISHRRHKAGHEVILACSGTPFFDENGNLRGYRGVARNVTELHHTERRLRDSEQRLRLSQQLSNIGSWEWHMPSGTLYWSDTAWRIFGYDSRNFRLSYERFLDLLHPADRNAVTQAIECCLINSTTFDEEHRIIWPDGSVHWVRSIGNIVIGEDSRPERMLGVVMPIDERKQAEQRLQASERKYRFLIDNAADAIVLVDEAARVIDANQRACKLFGHTRNDMIGIDAFTLSPDDQRERHIALFRKVVREGGPITEETEFHTRQGDRLPVEIRAARLQLDEGSLVQVILRDITARRQREAARQAQERRQREALVREVHHRIKNNLQGIIGLLRTQAHEYPELAPLLKQTIRHIQSISLIHGIHGRRDDGRLLLCEMLPAIVGTLPSFPERHRSHALELAITHPLAVAENEAVAMALILDELLTNACKHAGDPDRPVRIHLKTRTDYGEVDILNT